MLFAWEVISADKILVLQSIAWNIYMCPLRVQYQTQKHVIHTFLEDQSYNIIGPLCRQIPVCVLFTCSFMWLCVAKVTDLLEKLEHLSLLQGTIYKICGHCNANHKIMSFTPQECTTVAKQVFSLCRFLGLRLIYTNLMVNELLPLTYTYIEANSDEHAHKWELEHTITTYLYKCFSLIYKSIERNGS